MAIKTFHQPLLRFPALQLLHKFVILFPRSSKAGRLYFSYVPFFIHFFGSAAEATAHWRT
ncbi:MAG: hypothetical protein ACD_75C02102G0001, partial [uncultured bacterium]